MGHEDATPQEPRYAVLEVFGLKLEVSNPRLAELLTMDAREALTTDVRLLVPGRAPAGETPEEVAEDAEAVSTTLTVPTSDEALRLHREFRERVDTIGRSLGFEVFEDGTWRSPTGVEIATRIVERPLGVSAAAHYVAEVMALPDAVGGEGAVLFIVESQQTADVFKVAIQQRRLYHAMRTISIDNLLDVEQMLKNGALDHRQVVVMLAPVANIDVGEILAVLHADEQSG